MAMAAFRRRSTARRKARYRKPLECIAPPGVCPEWFYSHSLSWAVWHRLIGVLVGALEAPVLAPLPDGRHLFRLSRRPPGETTCAQGDGGCDATPLAVKTPPSAQGPDTRPAKISLDGDVPPAVGAQPSSRRHRREGQPPDVRC